MSCKCTICHGNDINQLGLLLATNEVIPFFKKDLLKLRYDDHPFPMKYDGLLASILAYSQALNYNRLHHCIGVYYTQNKWMLKFSNELYIKFGMKTVHESELNTEAKFVCEYNTDS